MEAFQKGCKDALPGVTLVIPVRPTGAQFLISLTLNENRTYVTIHEDDFADWGDGLRQEDLQTRVREAVSKLSLSPA